MRSRRIPILLLLPMLAALAVSAQEEKLEIVDGNLVITPEMAEKAKRRTERLRNPTFIKLDLAPVSRCPDEGSKKISSCYKTSGDIAIELFMTNTSSEAINITISAPYFEYDLQLYRDGELVPYRRDITKVLGQPPTAIYRSLLVNLEPGKKEKVDALSLAMWYDPPGAGHYQLDVKRRFLVDGGWTPEASATFEVTP
ncbi:MAG TPA: hypothetical protein VGX92_06295 [Pyrinomonadaceae bacterium]|nr:hypothetical protein [Pyrinomonadaceae bacterium]